MKLKTITLADLEKTDIEEQMLKVVEEEREAIDAFFYITMLKAKKIDCI